MKRIVALVSCIGLSFISVASYACTSVIVSSKVTGTGKPLMIKQRDWSKHAHNKAVYVEGPVYNFISITNSHNNGPSTVGGINTEGFCIMNTASNNSPETKQDNAFGSGTLMYYALGRCRNTKDFENMLDTLSRPLYIKGNVGIIDADGGAAYYQFKYGKWIKNDVNDLEKNPKGYYVMTNFTEVAKDKDMKGYYRYLEADAAMKDVDMKTISAQTLIDRVARSVYNIRTGIDYRRDYAALKASGVFNGVAIDQDMIMRTSTVSALVFEGVKKNEKPSHSIMWTIFGNPGCSVAIPMLATGRDIIPDYMKPGDKKTTLMNRISRKIRKKFLYPFEKESFSANEYIRMDNLIEGTEGRPALLTCCENAERRIREDFYAIYDKWCSKKMKDEEFYSKYVSTSASFINYYKEEFKSYLD